MDSDKAINLMVKKTGSMVAAQLEACTRCGMCAEACHYYQATGIPEYAPVWKVELLRRAYEQRFTVGGKLRLAVGLEKPITNDDIRAWSVYDFHACSVCNKCSFVCPMGISIGNLIGQVRAGLTAAGATPAGLQQKLETQVKTGSPTGDTEADWAAWFATAKNDYGIDLPVDKQGANSLIVFTNLELRGYKENLMHIARIMAAAGESWTLSLRARDAFNMGAINGDGKMMKQFAMILINTAKELGVKRLIVTECGHGYTTLRDKMPNVLGEPLPFTVEHITEVMAKFIAEGRIKLKPGTFASDGHTYTFHDSCKIQRAGGLMDEPRDILHTLCDGNFKEMTPNREAAICCGGGGGLRAIPEAYNNRMAAFGLKVEQIRQTGADTVVSTCSNCRLQFEDGFKHYKMDTRTKGLASLVAEALVE